MCASERERERQNEWVNVTVGILAHTHTKKTNERKPYGMFFLFGPVIG